MFASRLSLSIFLGQDTDGLCCYDNTTGHARDFNPTSNDGEELSFLGLAFFLILDFFALVLILSLLEFPGVLELRNLLEVEVPEEIRDDDQDNDDIANVRLENLMEDVIVNNANNVARNAIFMLI
ncbi:MULTISPECIES: hypothetical protein [Candidatus Ichthyocystis]|uniref:Putative membrane protein n=1 Tax=Candidatus Ichthyocystis hellenicum TaxID=1561003 RepID=A0A0S4M4U7_9BURK|nr:MULTISPECIES: hypothetical protein [Ichthyocystis]CUT17738.1 putative membrane protein [Candidatus Ichthyocystis hellenicum]